MRHMFWCAIERFINLEAKRLSARIDGECFFSPNLTTKSLKIAANFDQLKDRIPRILTARESFLEQQRCILLEVILLKHPC